MKVLSLAIGLFLAMTFLSTIAPLDAGPAVASPQQLSMDATDATALPAYDSAPFEALGSVVSQPLGVAKVSHTYSVPPPVVFEARRKRAGYTTIKASETDDEARSPGV